MLNWLQPAAGETILVVAAGCGFDAVGIEAYLEPDSANLICLEPSPIFTCSIPKRLKVLQTPFHEVPLTDESVDVVLNLAALHHIEIRDEVFNEWARVLKPGGRVVIGDVAQASGNGDFLNDSVDQLTPGGHKGVFLEEGYLTNAFSMRGFTNCTEGMERYTWNFKDEEAMITFSAKIFGMVNGSREQIKASIDRYLEPKCGGNLSGARFAWSLRFFKGFKPVSMK